MEEDMVAKAILPGFSTKSVAPDLMVQLFLHPHMP
jgi:hypothetical protein